MERENNEDRKFSVPWLSDEEHKLPVDFKNTVARDGGSQIPRPRLLLGPQREEKPDKKVD